MIEELRPLLKKFIVFAKDNLSFKRPPRLFLKQDTANQKCMLGKTAHYDPQKMAITLYVSGRHPKDILRSFSHELVHHCQNERGDLAPEKMKTINKNYAQENDHMRKMEKEAYLMGNMCFRDWEDGLDDKLQYKMQIAEQKFLKENKNMSVKLKRKDLKGLIEKLLEKRSLKEQKAPFSPPPIDGINSVEDALDTIKQPERQPRELKDDPIANYYYRELVRQTAQATAGAKAPEWLKQWKANRSSLSDVPKEDAKRIAQILMNNGQIDKLKLANLGYTLKEGRLDEKGCAAHSRSDDNMNIAAAGKRCDNPGAKLCPEGTCDTCDDKRALAEAKAEEGEMPDIGDNDGDGDTKESASDANQQKKENESGNNEEKKENESESGETEEKASGLTAAQRKKLSPGLQKAIASKVAEGSKIQTPEQENTLYESRFTGRNTRLFEKLLKEWTK